ncbi:MAG: hypothetical protein GY875_12185 [Gammaproteobacteria bacterium]|nr:hypothetical protein [Gammaproteobacteria bacterium]
MTPGSRARNCNELIEIINQALDEVEDLRVAIEYDEEYRVNQASSSSPLQTV